MTNAIIAGVGMTRFGKHLDTGLKALGREALLAALADAGIDKEAIEAAYVGNAMAGLITGQECIRGQVVLRSAGIGAIPVINVENACASASTAFHQAATMVEAGVYDVVLALGVEKLYHEDKTRSFKAIGSAVDTEEMATIMAGLKKAAEAKGADTAASVFGGACLYLARIEPQLLQAMPLRMAGTVVAGLYCLLGLRYWFWIPASATGFGVLVFVSGLFAVP